MMSKKFDLSKWDREMRRYLKGASFVGTKSADPLVRWKDRALGPFRFCDYCGGAFTPLGLPKHVRTHTNPKKKEKHVQKVSDLLRPDTRGARS